MKSKQMWGECWARGVVMELSTSFQASWLFVQPALLGPGKTLGRIVSASTRISQVRMILCVERRKYVFEGVCRHF
ncbi:MAG TPA: hypothetical protein VMX13_04900 [Sedimentisphaerales bacterium]|nr:hypothetical protein [Sedimentisphaerales bacterium]